MNQDMKRKNAVVTGVSRRQGIGYAIVRQLLDRGASVFVTHFEPHDREQPWGSDPIGSEAVLDTLRQHLNGSSQTLNGMEIDLAEPDAPAAVFKRARKALGPVHMLVCNQAQSGYDGPLLSMTRENLDRHFAVNARSSIELSREFVAQFPDAGDEGNGDRGVADAGSGRAGSGQRQDPTGRIVFMSSGQQLGPMPGEVAYSAAKGALVGIIPTLAHELAPCGITVNAVNPGPVDTGYVTDELREATAGLFPFGRWGAPDDAARLVVWLCSDDGRWITGQVINSEGGFRRPG